LIFHKYEQKHGFSEGRGGNCHVFAYSFREMLLKAIGQLLGTAERVQESCWEMPKGCWIAFWKF
jgi:hypothetical protein